VIALALLIVSSAVVIYSHFGYPALMAALASLARRARDPEPGLALPPAGGPPRRPTVSILVAAWNEEKVIGEKIDNALAQDYPEDLLEIVVATDGCTDRTNEIVSSRLAKRVRLVALPQRGGKARAIRHAAAVAKGEVFVLTDANTYFQKDAVSILVDRLQRESDVSCAFGDVQIRPDGCPYGASEGIFYKIERRLQLDESELDSAIGVDGALYAIRREAFVVPPDGAILDDLEAAIEATRDGKRVVYEPRAIAWEEATPTLLQEFRRKTRIVAGGIQAIREGRMTPDANRPWLWFCFASHKLLRWATPIFLILALVAAFAAACSARETISQVGLVALATQLAFYAAAVAGWALHETLDLGKLSLPVYFASMHAAALVGIVRGFRGRQAAAWQRADRKTPTAAPQAG
jgi:cellulose synthase/poly-beta-1,6-N-acetylglucosamine synthase-like glycosyltransferase